MTRMLSKAEREYLNWWDKATPLERVELEIKTLEYQIKVKKLERLGKQTPAASYTYRVLNIHRQWKKDDDAKRDRGVEWQTS